MSAMAFVDGNQDPEVEGSTDNSKDLENGSLAQSQEMPINTAYFLTSSCNNTRICTLSYKWDTHFTFLHITGCRCLCHPGGKNNGTGWQVHVPSKQKQKKAVVALLLLAATPHGSRFRSRASAFGGGLTPTCTHHPRPRRPRTSVDRVLVPLTLTGAVVEVTANGPASSGCPTRAPSRVAKGQAQLERVGRFMPSSNAIFFQDHHLSESHIPETGSNVDLTQRKVFAPAFLPNRTEQVAISSMAVVILPMYLCAKLTAPAYSDGQSDDSGSRWVHSTSWPMALLIVAGELSARQSSGTKAKGQSHRSGRSKCTKEPSESVNPSKPGSDGDNGLPNCGDGFIRSKTISTFTLSPSVSAQGEVPNLACSHDVQSALTWGSTKVTGQVERVSRWLWHFPPLLMLSSSISGSEQRLTGFLCPALVSLPAVALVRLTKCDGSPRYKNSSYVPFNLIYGSGDASDRTAVYIVGCSLSRSGGLWSELYHTDTGAQTGKGATPTCTPTTYICHRL
ncbi:hypothetical protein L210DRAFT_3633732 [Boletus edulis BED1]|uniref:Uncharacterized protein n=1 Tax=Boletus edulis BED1 TaxID=1328754 RepID=A0AAD4BI91_BOLED|nr:hypothetical protein L210DRAFT_3633732 [Boletus edulis BED1]